MPKPPEGSRRAKLQGSSPAVSRFEELKARGVPPKMPPNPGPRFTEWLIEMGLTEAAGMGATVLSWQEIDAWCHRTGIDIAPWEARLIRKLSAAYLAENRRAESENCPPPWRGEVTEREQQVELDRLRMVLG